MGIFTFEEEHNSTLAPAKLYKTFVKDSDNIIPKVVEAIQSVEIVEGNGGPGTIKKITAVEGGKSSYVLHKVEAIDEANLVYNYSIVGGTELEDKLEKVSFETKVLPGPHGGSVLKITTKFYTKEVREATKFVKEVNIIQGDGEAGSIKQVNFNEASPFKYLKQRSDVLDKDNLVCKYTTMAAGSSSVPYVVPYPGRYSAHPQQLYGGYPQPQSGFGYPSQPGFVYPPQPGLVAESSSMPYVAPYPDGYSPQPHQLYGGYPQPQSGFEYPPQPGFVYAVPVQNLGTNNLFGKLGALAVGVLSEVIGNLL